MSLVFDCYILIHVACHTHTHTNTPTHRYVYNSTFPNGIFAGVQAGSDGGQCGYPAANIEAEREYANSQPEFYYSVKDTPSQDDFNPEGACRFALASKYFGACLDPNETECCEMLSHFRSSSSAPFCSCLCVPSFFKQAETLLEGYGRNLSETLERCGNPSIPYVGNPRTWCGMN